MVIEKLTHKEKKGSAFLWFLLALVPLARLYFLWKAAGNVSGHEILVNKYKFLSHLKPKEDTTNWFLIFIIPDTIAFAELIYFFLAFIVLQAPIWGFIALLNIILLLGFIALVVHIFKIWKIGEVISGHEKVYEKYERLEHSARKGSNVEWVIIGIIPFLNLYFYWRTAEMIAGHEKQKMPNKQAVPSNMEQSTFFLVFT